MYQDQLFTLALLGDADCKSVPSHFVFELLAAAEVQRMFCFQKVANKQTTILTSTSQCSVLCASVPCSSKPCVLQPFAYLAFVRFAMPVVSEMVHPRGLNFKQQKRVVKFRDLEGMSFPDIAKKVKNLQGKHPTAQCCSDVYDRFNEDLGHAKSGYHKCGRKKWAFTPDVEAWLVKKLLQLRKVCVCTSTTLQHALARERGVKVSSSGVRKLLLKKGYKWLPRSQKRLYSKKDREARERWCKAVVRMSAKELKAKLNMSMDGVIVTMPPADATARYNYCRFGESHMWRKPGEAISAELAGDDAYGKQAALARCVPMWGGCSAGGFAIITMHENKKLTADEWVQCMESGAVKKALQSINRGKRSGPWTILCDNEGFLEAGAAKKIYKKLRIKMWHCPDRSPDLNPVELFWAYMRKRLRKQDLADAVAKRPVLSKDAYKKRVRQVCNSKAAQTAAKNIALRLKKACKAVAAAGGQAIHG